MKLTGLYFASGSLLGSGVTMIGSNGGGTGSAWLIFFDVLALFLAAGIEIASELK